MKDVSGLPLEVALARLAARGIRPEVRMTEAPRRPVEAGEIRALRLQAQDRELLAAVFPPPLATETEKEGPG